MALFFLFFFSFFLMTKFYDAVTTWNGVDSEPTQKKKNNFLCTIILMVDGGGKEMTLFKKAKLGCVKRCQTGLFDL